MRSDRAERHRRPSTSFWLSLVGTLKVVSICWGLLQGRVGDVGLFMGFYAWLEKVRHKEDLQDTGRELKTKKA